MTKAGEQYDRAKDKYRYWHEKTQSAEYGTPEWQTAAANMDTWLTTAQSIASQIYLEALRLESATDYEQTQELLFQYKSFTD